ncbi:MAG: hypothetical protein BA871_05240 [Desulfuromonadales bacterium C00003096]|nr:MAG: hypothetical protein BA871_05240 [Desulfuromonadales bacterium C00003096]
MFSQPQARSWDLIFIVTAKTKVAREAVCRTIAFVTSDENKKPFLVHFEFQPVWRRSPFADSLWAGTFHLLAKFKQTLPYRFIDRS